MKKASFVLLSSLFLFSCGNPNGSISSESSFIEESSIEVSRPEIGDVYITSTWDEGIAYLIDWASPGASELLIDPGYEYYEVISDYAYEVADDPSSEIKFTQITASPVVPYASSVYLDLLAQNGFVLSSSGTYAYHRIGEVGDLIVECVDSTKGSSRSLVIRLYTMETRSKEYSPELVNIITGLDIPMVSADSYEVFYNSNSISAGVYAYGVGINEFQEFIPDLEESGFTLSTSGEGYYELTHEDRYVSIFVMESVDAYNDPCLYLRFSNLCPRVYVLSILDNDVPLLPLDRLEFDYSFVGDSEILTLYYDKALEADYLEYQRLLVSSGFEEIENTSYYSDALGATILTSTYEIEGKRVQVLYNPISQTIAIPILG